MWYSERHRESVRAASPVAYRLEILGEALWLLALLALPLTAAAILFRALRGDWGALWLLLLPPLTALLAALLRGRAAALLAARGYRYDYASDTGHLEPPRAAPPPPLNRGAPAPRDP